MSGGTRNEYEAAIGAVIARFNDIEIALIDLICCMVGDNAKGEAIGWSIGFDQKIRVVAALARSSSLDDYWHERLFEAIAKASTLSNEVRNQVAHMEVWENPFDETIGLRKGSVSVKHGFRANHFEWTADALQKKADEIAETAETLKQIRVIFDFDPISEDVKGD